MTTEQAKNLSESALTRLMEALEQGQSEALKAYLAVMSRFHRYSWGNILLIYSQLPTATHVAGFHAWLKLRRFVRKGEKGIVILAPMVGRKKSDQDELTEDDGSRLFGFRAAHVFDVSQTDGESSREPGCVLDRLNKVLLNEKTAGFTTCCAALFESDGRLTIANAGHVAPYINGQELPVNLALPLGVMPEAEYVCKRSP